MMKTIARLGDKMLGALLPTEKAAACWQCQAGGVSGSGPYLVYKFSKNVGSQWRCYRMQNNSCSGTPYSYTVGCC